MQIHELTKRRKRADEGLLDGVKAAVSAANTGFKGQGVAGGKGIAGALKALSSSQAQADALSDVYQQQIDKHASAVSNKLVQTALSQARRAPATKLVIDKVIAAADQAIKTKANKITQGTLSTSKTSKTSVNNQDGIMPPAGRAIKVAMPGRDGNKHIYYKDDKGVWYNEVGQAVPPANTRNLENAADSSGSEVSGKLVPGAIARLDAYNKKQRDLKMQNKRKVTKEQLGNVSKVNPDRVLITQDEIANIVDQVIGNDQTYGAGWEQGKNDDQFKNVLSTQLAQAVQSSTDPAKFKQAIAQYVTTAMAASITHMNSSQRSTRSDTIATDGEEQFADIADQADISQYQLQKLGAAMGVKNQTVRSTNNPALDKLITSTGARVS